MLHENRKYSFDIKQSIMMLDKYLSVITSNNPFVNSVHDSLGAHLWMVLLLIGN